MTLEEFLNMGGYAAYVWPSYAIAALVLALNAWLPLRRRRRLLDDLKRRARARRPA